MEDFGSNTRYVIADSAEDAARNFDTPRWSSDSYSKMKGKLDSYRKDGILASARLYVVRRQFDVEECRKVPVSGPYCAFCNNATADLKTNPEAFDIHRHIQHCKVRLALLQLADDANWYCEFDSPSQTSTVPAWRGIRNPQEIAREALEVTNGGLD